jgi:predicted DNA-binding protein (MmcQ/YjbR family)
MRGKSLQRAAQRCAESLPEVALEHPFGDGWEVFKVNGRVFMLMTEVPGRPVVIVKADPVEAEALQAAHPDITPGYHMNKKHWITLTPDGSLDRRLVEELVTESYRLVVGKMPRSQRPAEVQPVGHRALSVR